MFNYQIRLVGICSEFVNQAFSPRLHLCNDLTHIAPEATLLTQNRTLVHTKSQRQRCFNNNDNNTNESISVNSVVLTRSLCTEPARSQSKDRL